MKKKVKLTTKKKLLPKSKILNGSLRELDLLQWKMYSQLILPKNEVITKHSQIGHSTVGTIAFLNDSKYKSGKRKGQFKYLRFRGVPTIPDPVPSKKMTNEEYIVACNKLGKLLHAPRSNKQNEK